MKCSEPISFDTDPSSNETMFEVYQLPRDTWGKEMEDVKNKLIQAEESKVQEPVSSQHLSSTQETAEVYLN